jgi:D-sedoheptulose 7-phosphate isomerase
MQTKIKSAIDKRIANLEKLKSLAGVIEDVANAWTEALGRLDENGERKNKILFCGNGGSAADAQHWSAELVNSYKIRGRAALPSLALTTDSSQMTAWANDFGFESQLARQVEAHGRKGDVLIGISTSGNSKNVLAAFEVARDKGILTIAFTGGTGGEMAKAADIALIAPSDITNEIQEMHEICGHDICGMVEEHFFGAGK